MEFKWLHPELLWLGPALFAAVLVSAYAFEQWRKKSWKKLGIRPEGSPLVQSHFGAARFYTRHTLLALGMLFVGLSLANLQMGGKKQTVNRKGADVVFALDVSRSMWTEDIAPSRLEKAKLLISRTIDELGGDRVGIVAYAGSAYPALPITTDYAAAKMALIAASPDAVPIQGTNLASALEFSWGYFNPASPAGRFVVVLTDGEDHESVSKAVLPEFEVNTILVGLGTTTGGPIPVERDKNGTTYKKDRYGDVVISRRDEAKLARIAEELGSVYIDGNRTENALRALQDRLTAGDKADIQEEIAIDYDDQFQWFLFPAVLFFLLYLSLPSRPGAIWKKGTLVWVALLSTSAAFAQPLPGDSSSINLGLPDVSTVPGHQRDNEYQRAMRAGDAAIENMEYAEAARRYGEALAFQPKNFEPQYNLGTSLLKMGELESAVGALAAAAQNKNATPAQSSDALFNLGNALYAAENYAAAAEAYKESLRRQPGRKDAQYNLSRSLEKLMQQKQQQQQQQQPDQQQQEQQEQESDPEQQPESDNPNEDPMDRNDQNNDAKSPEDQQGQSDPGQDDGQREENQPEQGGTGKAKMTPEEIKGLLEAVQRAEQRTAEKMAERQTKGQKKSGDKDW